MLSRSFRSLFKLKICRASFNTFLKSAVIQNVNGFYSTSVYLIDEEKDSIIKKNKTCIYTYRSCTCGDLRLEHVGLSVTLCGWIEYQRLDKFLILRDAYGQTQLLIKDNNEDIRSIVRKLPFESILKVQGTVLSRPKEMINKKLPTGEIEVSVDNLQVLNEASELPFNIRDFQKAKESLRMQFRYLDLRFPEMQRNLRTRSDLLFKMRQFLMEANFVDVETPTLFKATPGGAQEFIVPSKFPGQFYSLVQSPQQFKQMLMAGGIDRYFQVARCYRDETSRPDRQPEFTQLDIEMSFTTVDDVIAMVEGLLNHCWPNFAGTIPPRFDKLAYSDAIEYYGSDQPDIRFDFKLQNCSSILQATELNTLGENFGAYFLKFPSEYASLPTSIKEKFSTLARTFPGVSFLQNKVSGPDQWFHKMKKLFSEEILQQLVPNLDLDKNSVVFFAFGEKKHVVNLLGKVRVLYANHLESTGMAIRKKGMHLTWIVDFPLFEKSDDSDAILSAHHPFTAPNPEDLHLMSEAPLKVRALAYDLVLNGNEIAGGSIRIHDPLLQESVFKMLNINVHDMKHILEMLRSGCPPHGGIAVGLDRLLSILLGTQSIRDVIAFPKSAEGRDLLSGAPSAVSKKDLDLYHIQCRN